jgi:hypothetical protein
VEVTEELLSTYRNQGGLDMLGRSQETFDTKVGGCVSVCVCVCVCVWIVPCMGAMWSTCGCDHFTNTITRR